MKFHSKCLLLMLLLPPSYVFAANNVCQAAGQATLNSCKTAAQSAYFATAAACDNDSKASQRKACLHQAQSTLNTALSSCDAQSTARLQVCQRLGGGPYDPQIDPANFTTTIDNPYFPLKPGTTYVYEGHTSSGFEHNEFAVTSNNVVIDGVTTVEVHDTRVINNQLAEDTRDWFAQDHSGNVWYFGENSAVIQGGLPTSLAGSFSAGVNGARPGIVMEANNSIGDFYLQEFSPNNAEDEAEVFKLNQTVTVPIGTFDHVLVTKESSPLEPGLVEFKYWAPGIGNIKTDDNGDITELVEIKTQ